MHRFIVLFAGYFLLASSGIAQEEATFEGLGFLEENFESLALGVSGDGAVVVGGSLIDPQQVIYEAFRWEDGEMVGLGNLPNNLYPGTTANDVSVDGSVIVGESWAFGGARETFYWEISADSMIRMGGLPGDEYLSWAAGVSADGSIVVGGSYRLSDNSRDGFIWDVAADTTIGLGVYSATGVSADGSVVVGGVVTEICEEAFRWEDGVLELLGALPGGKICLAGAFDISADGTVVVGNSWGIEGVEAFRWEASTDTMIGLGIPSNGQTSSANAVSADGSVVVGSYSTSGGGELRASIWTEETGMRDLQEVLENDYDLDLTGWTLLGVGDISDDGLVLVGSGHNPDGTIEAWRAFLGKPVANEASPEEIADVLSVPSPNPVSEVSTLTIAVERGQNITVEAFDVTGRRVQTLYGGALAAGMSETLTLDASALPAGVYVIRATGEDFSETRQVTIVR